MTAEKDDPGDRDAGAGRAYMQRLRERWAVERIVREQARDARRRLSGIAAPYVRGEGADVSLSPPSLTLSHLVPRECLEAYRAALSAANREMKGRALVLRGPSAPYSFVANDEL